MNPAQGEGLKISLGISDGPSHPCQPPVGRRQNTAALPICAALGMSLAIVRLDEGKTFADPYARVVRDPEALPLVEPDARHCDLGLEFSADGEDAYPPQAARIKGEVSPVRGHRVEGDNIRLPVLGRNDRRPI